MQFFKIQKPALGVPAIEIFFKSRRCQRRPLPPVSKRTSLVIFLKLDLEFGFFFLNELLPYKTQIFSYSWSLEFGGFGLYAHKIRRSNSRFNQRK